ncbi:hypothetical protein J2755_001975 [Methanohalophilus levihalophilus]|uniref:DUF7287 family protein n=1 Tax=Methanohalophilus levihalophilus TaxID=1431282 RepID=UPI001AE204C2|nr:hypothetical protein [Methanohalophilus levihalophilus]MBP2031027.1 hypothetical protein [Methanohalophilus levihalophilus]
MRCSDEEGQIAIDFLFGMSFFVIALLFTVQFVPTLFLSASESQEDLGIVSHRTASILAEDPGWWSNSTHKGTDWEANINSTQRVGLAEDSNPLSRQTDTPNLLNTTKVLKMTELDEGSLTTMLGLYENLNGARINYSYNITIARSGTPLVIDAQEIAIGEPIPEKTAVLRTKRIVMVSSLTAATFDFDELPAPTAPNEKVIINVTGPIESNAVIQITNFNISGPNPKFVGITEIAPTNAPLNEGTDFTIYKNVQGSPDYIATSSSSLTLNATDTLRLDIRKDYFTNNTYTLEINFNQMDVTYGTIPPSYNDRASQVFKPADLEVSIWK